MRGNAALAFKRFHQRGFFSDFVGSGAAVPINVEVTPAAENILAEKPFGIGVANRLLHDDREIAIFAANIDVSAGAPTAKPPIITPSITACGSCSKIRRSLQVPGSLSSPLHRHVLRLG